MKLAVQLLSLLGLLRLSAGLDPAGPWPLALLGLVVDGLNPRLSLAPSLLLGLALLPLGAPWAALAAAVILLLRWQRPARQNLTLLALVPCLGGLRLAEIQPGFGAALVHLHLLLSLLGGAALGNPLRPGEALVCWATGCLGLGLLPLGSQVWLALPVLAGLLLASRSQAQAAEQFLRQQLDRKLRRSQASLTSTQDQLHKTQRAMLAETDVREQLQQWLQRLATLLEMLQRLARLGDEEAQWAGLQQGLTRLLPHRQQRIFRSPAELDTPLARAIQAAPPALELSDPFPTGLGFCLDADGECLGVVALQTEQAPSREELLFASVVGTQVGLALRNTRLRAQAEEAYRQQRDSQAQMVESSKLAAVGQLAAGMAHELNTPLATVLMAVEMAALEASGPRCKDNLELARREVQRAQLLIEKVLYYARDARSLQQDCDLNQIVEDTLLLVENQLRQANIQVDRQLARLPTLQANPHELQQVVLNLLLNARDAVEGHPQPRVLLATRQREQRLELLIQDNGCGLDESTRQRMFEPFFTTKAVGKGTGLGLSISREIVERHAGSLQLEGEPGQGCRAVLSLPIPARSW